MVDNKSRSLQWPIINLASYKGSHTDASTKGWGATCNGISTEGMWSTQEMKYQINILELLAVKLAIQTVTKYRDVKAIHLQVENIVVSTYLMQMGDTQNLKMVELAKEISLEVGDHNYCRIPPKRIEFNSSLVISKHCGLLTVDAESSKISESLPDKGLSRDRFVCILSVTSDTNLCCMETRSSQSCNRCISIELVTKSPVCFSNIFHDSKSC